MTAAATTGHGGPSCLEVRYERQAADGGVAPLVAAVYPLSEIAAAQARFLAKDFIGKLVIEP